MTIQAVLFDLDETLVVETASAEAAFLATCEQARLRYDIEPQSLAQAVRRRAGELWRAAPTITYCRAIGISSWEGLAANFDGADPQLAALRAWAPTYRRAAWSRALADYGVYDAPFAAELAETFPRERGARHVAFTDAAPLLRTLQGRYRLAVLTNGAPAQQRAKLHGSGLAAYFETVVVSGEVGVGKPDPRVFEAALAALAVAPSAAVMVGDSIERDIAGAQAAGLHAIWLNRSGMDYHPGEHEPPAEQLTALSQLPAALEMLQGR